MNKLFFLGFLFVSFLSYGSAIIALDGKFYGKTDKTFILQLHQQIYTLDKSKLTPDQIKYLNGLHWQDKLTIAVAIEAVKDVHDKK